MSNELTITPERAYLEALRAAGPAGEDIDAWLGRVERIGSSILSSAKRFVRQASAVAHSISLVGVVVEAEETVESEEGRKLNLFRVTFKADSGQRSDRMWLDKTKPGDVELFRIAQSLIGKRAKVLKEQRVQFKGDDPETDNEGKPITRPYMAAIEPLEAGGAGPVSAPRSQQANADGGQQERALRQAQSERSAPGIGLSTELPTTATGVQQLAKSLLSINEADVRKKVEMVIGPKPEGSRRPPEAYSAAWRGIEVLSRATERFGLADRKTLSEVSKAIGRRLSAGEYYTAEEWEKAWRVLCQTHEEAAAA